MGSSAKSHTYDVLRNRAREADAQVVNVHLDGRLYRREGHLFHPVGHPKRAPPTLVLQRSPRSAADSRRGPALDVVAQNSYFLQGCVGVHDRSGVWSGVRMSEGVPATMRH